MTWCAKAASPSGIGKPRRRTKRWSPRCPNWGLADLQAAYQLRQKSARSQKLKEVYKSVAEKLAAAGVEADGVEVDNILFELESKIVRGQILNGEPRIDGRDTRTVRPIEIRSSVLPRAHGSALFTRGETQALVVAALGTKSDEQIIDALQGEYRDRFMLHYNMPPFATGETGRVAARSAAKSATAAWPSAH